MNRRETSSASQTCEIRRVAPRDAATLKAIRLAALADTPSAFGSTYAEEVERPDQEWSLRADAAAAGDLRTTFLAHIGRRAVGLAGGYREDAESESVELVSMWASPDVRRRGIGRLLVGAVVGWAIETNASSVGLWVTQGNDPARLLYESMGFRATGDVQPLPSDPCADEVKMRLDLDLG